MKRLWLPGAFVALIILIALAAPLLGLPDGHAIAAMLGIGHPVDQPTKLRRNPVDSFTTIDTVDGPPFRPT